MKKIELKLKFIKLRAMEYTYPEICNELHISKPTAINWGKLYSEEIDKVQKKLLTNIFAKRIMEQEYGLIISINGLKRLSQTSPTDEIANINKRIGKRLEKIFVKKVVAVQIIMKVKSDEIDKAIFIFNDNVKVVEQKNSPS
jgi:hypothetical protein